MVDSIKSIIEMITLSGNMTTELLDRFNNLIKTIERKKNIKIVYELLLRSIDKEKLALQSPILIDFPQDADPAWCVKMCIEHYKSEDGIECYGAMPKVLMNSNFCFEYPRIE